MASTSTTTSTAGKEHLDVNWLYEQGKKNPLSMAQGREILKMHFRSYNGFDPENNFMYFLLAEQGVGKSSLIRQCSRELGMPVARYVCGGAEHEDYCGIPNQTADSKFTRYTFPPDFPAEEPDGGKGILIIDEMSTANTQQQEQIKQLLTEGHLAFHKIPPGWIPVAAGNPPIRGFTGARKLCVSLMSRVRVRVLCPKPEEKMMYWATKDSFSPTLYKFLKMNPGWIDTYEPRWMTNTAKMILQMEQAGLDRGLLVKNLEYDMGQMFATDFMNFLALGDDPNCYPISAREFMRADQTELNTLYRRIETWVDANRQDAKLTATLDDIFNIWIANGNDLPIDIVDRLVGLLPFMRGDWIRKMFSVCRVQWEASHMERLLALAEAVKRHPSYNDAKVEIEAVMKHVNAARKVGRFRSGKVVA